MKTNPALPFVLAAGLCSIGSLSAQDKKLFAFDGAAEDGKWFSVDDGVMGGLSKGEADIKHGSLHFRGNLSLENKGGFSSIRVAAQPDLSGKKKLVMRVKGDGRTYTVVFATDARHNDSDISYGATFSTEAGQWIEVEVPFESLSPSWRGDKLEGPAFDPAEVEEVGILIGDKKEGPFSLEVDWIAAK